jgi:anthranilate/para-aminobenzoate synthase component II
VFETSGEQNDDIIFLAYGVSKNGTNVTAGDVTGDGIDEIITGPGPGAVFGPHIRGWSINASQSVSIDVLSFLAYGTKKWGANVAAGDIDSDGYDEIVTGAGPGYVFGPHVRAWNFDDDQVSTINGVSYFAYGTRHWGVNVATGNLDNDARDEILTGPGPGTIFGPQVRGWNFTNNTVTSIHQVNFFAYDTRKFGVNVAAGDLDGDGFDEIVTGPGPGAGLGPWVRVWNYDNSQVGPFIQNFKAYDQGKYGVNVGTASAFGY